ncbi:unnamed protein product, partial [Ectocarpus sp. 4 AP-2014]
THTLSPPLIIPLIPSHRLYTHTCTPRGDVQIVLISKSTTPYPPFPLILPAALVERHALRGTTINFEMFFALRRSCAATHVKRSNVRHSPRLWRLRYHPPSL